MTETPKPKGVIHVPRDILTRLNLGQTFAEYDRVLLEPGVFVKTPAVLAAEEDSRSKCFFVGRRGTGKTAIARYLAHRTKSVLEIHPEIFSTADSLIPSKEKSTTQQVRLRALVSCLRRALLDEVLRYHAISKRFSFDLLPRELRSERNLIEDFDFDTRVFEFISETFHSLESEDQKGYLKQINRAKAIAHFFEKNLDGELPATHILIDRIDDSWDGSDAAVTILMALSHACLELASTLRLTRPMLFLRENVFDRVRHVDTEFTRLETCVVSLDWTEEQLIEMIERRLQRAMNPKPKLGDTWEYLFEKMADQSSRASVFAFCQRRPRDVIRFCAGAVEAAVNRRHEIVKLEDLQESRRQFSLGSLKDLADEYCENYPQIQLILSRFHGLAPEFTVHAISAFIQKLLVDNDIQKYCATWLYSYTSPPQFVELLWSIGFFGIRDNDSIDYRGFGAMASAAPPISDSTHAVIHPSFHDALDLQAGMVIGDLAPGMHLQTQGMLVDIPESLDLSTFMETLKSLLERLDTCPEGMDSFVEFEDIVGEVLRLCFFRVLVNVQPKSRSNDGKTVRDWVASNVSQSGFWEMIRSQYDATQVTWECKNYKKLSAGDFHQMAYYINDRSGRFVVTCFRGDREELEGYFGHIRRIADEKRGMVLLLTDQDLKVFIRQALKGKVKDDHIRERFDATVRAIS